MFEWIKSGAAAMFSLIAIFFAFIFGGFARRSDVRKTHPENSPQSSAHLIMDSLYELEFKLSDPSGKPIDLASFKGRPVLFVNTATRCGLTPQLKMLQSLHEKFPNLVIIGCPTNQFLWQAPGSSKDVAEFCVKNYGVSFQMTEKLDVNGDNAHPLYKWLKQSKNRAGSSSGDWFGLRSTQSVKWNFEKFLLDEEGRVVERWAPSFVDLESALVNLDEEGKIKLNV